MRRGSVGNLAAGGREASMPVRPSPTMGGGVARKRVTALTFPVEPRSWPVQTGDEAISCSNYPIPAAL
jgi:hypothetical protein